jgi:hypothetical protein
MYQPMHIVLQCMNNTDVFGQPQGKQYSAAGYPSTQPNH